MEIGLGHLRYPGPAFWALSLKEWLAAVDGYMESIGVEQAEPFSRDDLAALMEEYPDDRRAP